jgi:hypothetical protein
MKRFFYLSASWISGLVGLKPSHLFPSPSKFFLLRKLKACLDLSSGMSVGVDVACADLKYRDMFKTQRYVGIDLDRVNLSKGLALRARPEDVGILANLLQLEQVPPFADVLVSTHTIASLPADLQVQAVHVLARAVLPNGTFFVNIPTTDQGEALEKALRNSFGVVGRTVYGNPLFMKVENFFAYRTGSKNPLALMAVGLASVVCYFLSFLEELKLFRSHGSYTLFYCRNRRGVESEDRFAPIRALSQL